MSHSVLTPNVYYTYCTPSRCTGCTELIPHLARPYVFVFSSLTVANLGSHSTIGPGSKRLLGCASHSNSFFQQVPNILIFSPNRDHSGPAQIPITKHGKKKKKKKNQIQLKWNWNEIEMKCSICLFSVHLHLWHDTWAINYFPISNNPESFIWSISPLYGVLRTSIFPLYKKKRPLNGCVLYTVCSPEPVPSFFFPSYFLIFFFLFFLSILSPLL